MFNAFGVLLMFFFMIFKYVEWKSQRNSCLRQKGKAWSKSCSQGFGTRTRRVLTTFPSQPWHLRPLHKGLPFLLPRGTTTPQEKRFTTTWRTLAKIMVILVLCLHCTCIAEEAHEYHTLRLIRKLLRFGASLGNTLGFFLRLGLCTRFWSGVKMFVDELLARRPPRLASFRLRLHRLEEFSDLGERHTTGKSATSLNHGIRNVGCLSKWKAQWLVKCGFPATVMWWVRSMFPYLCSGSGGGSRRGCEPLKGALVPKVEANGHQSKS